MLAPAYTWRPTGVGYELSLLKRYQLQVDVNHFTALGPGPCDYCVQLLLDPGDLGRRFE